MQGMGEGKTTKGKRENWGNDEFRKANDKEDLAEHFTNMGWSVVPPGKKSNRPGTGMGVIGYKGKKEEQVERPPGLNPIDKREPDKRWKKVSMTLDSGAVDTVFPVGTVAGEQPTVATRSGFKYYGGDGSAIPHRGEVKFQGETERGSKFKMTAQVAKITKPLCSVRRMTQAGNRDVFDEAGSYVENKATGERTEIHESKGDYHMEVWVDNRPGENGDAARLATVEENGCASGCQCEPPPRPYAVPRTGRQFRL